MRLINKTLLYELLDVRSTYSDLERDEDALAEEVLAHYAGRHGAKRLAEEYDRLYQESPDVVSRARVRATFDDLRDALKRFWTEVADFLGITKYKSLEEVADKVLSDLLHGVNPNTAVEQRSKGKGKGKSKSKNSEKTEAEDQLSTSEKEETIAQAEDELEQMRSELSARKLQALDTMRSYYDSGAIPGMAESQFKDQARYIFVGSKNREGLELMNTPGLQEMLAPIDELAERVRYKDLQIRNSEKILAQEKGEAKRSDDQVRMQKGATEESDGIRFRYTERADGSLLSENELEAESYGKFRKVYGVSPTDFEMLRALGLIVRSEWHHTGKTFRETDYFSWADNTELDNGYHGKYSLQENGVFDYNAEGESSLNEDAIAEEDAPAQSLSEWYKDHKKEIKELARQYKEASWRWKEHEPVRLDGASFVRGNHNESVFLAGKYFPDEVGNSKEYDTTLEDVFFRRELEASGAKYSDLSDEQKSSMREQAKADEATFIAEHRDDVNSHNVATQALYDEAEEQTNGGIRKDNLSQTDSKEATLLSLAGLLGKGESESYDLVRRQSESAQRNGGKLYRDTEESELAAINDRFNEELQAQIEGTLPAGHVYQLGYPSEILRSTGVPNLPIELSASRAKEKSEQGNHVFPLSILRDLPSLLHNPIAVFAYGDKAKAQNIIVEVEHEGKSLLIGLSLNQSKDGLVVNSVRGLFPKDTHEWLTWIQQGKALYLNKEVIQTKIAQQRINLADVSYLNLDET